MVFKITNKSQPAVWKIVRRFRERTFGIIFPKFYLTIATLKTEQAEASQDFSSVGTLNNGGLGGGWSKAKTLISNQHHE